MLIELCEEISPQEEEHLIKRLKTMGLQAERSGKKRLTVVSGVDASVKKEHFQALKGIKRVTALSSRFKLASRLAKPEKTVISLKGVSIGDGTLFVCAGPCSIESEAQMRACASAAKKSGAQALRGGAFKPRTSPYEFQGMGVDGLKLLQKVGEEFGLLTISEVMDASQVALASPLIDILQVGARNMQNFNLLKELGKVKNPILLKRGFSATYQDLLMAAEYILSEGNPNVILCERGIRTFETHTRNTLDLNAVPALKELTHLPVIVDPSHGTGVRSLVSPMARASLAAGADGLIIEMHPEPEKSVSDAQQTLSLESFAQMMRECSQLHRALKDIA